MLYFKECQLVLVLLFVEFLQRRISNRHLGDVCAKYKICTADVLYLLLFFLSFPSVLSHVRLFEALWTIACQAPLSMGFSRA